MDPDRQRAASGAVRRPCDLRSAVAGEIAKRQLHHEQAILRTLPLRLACISWCSQRSTSILYGGILKHARSADPIEASDAVIFSLANLVTLTVRDYAVPGFVGAAIQTVQVVSAYLFLGYVIWQITRSFES